jgi:hypothetical protein
MNVNTFKTAQIRLCGFLYAIGFQLIVLQLWDIRKPLWYNEFLSYYEISIRASPGDALNFTLHISIWLSISKDSLSILFLTPTDAPNLTPHILLSYT